MILGQVNSAGTATTEIDANTSGTTLPTFYATNSGYGSAVEALATGGPGAVWGLNHGTGPGISGGDDSVGTGIAVFGGLSNNSNTSPAVQGRTEGSGPGVNGISLNGRGVVAEGLVAQLSLVPSDHPTHPSGGEPGDLFVDFANRLWFCQGNSKWLQLSANLVLLPTARRAYDSRRGDGRLAANSTRTVSLAPLVPAGASAAVINLTATDTTGTGWLAVYAAGATYEGTSNLNFVRGLTIANSATTLVDTTRQVTVRSGGAATDFVIDVAGYYP